MPNDKQMKELYQFPEPTAPFQRVHMGIAGPIDKKDDNEETYILVTVDAFSHYIVTSPLKNQKATSVVKAVINDVVTKHGCPELIISDNGQQFKGKLFEALTKAYGITHRFITPYNPAANGAVERQNRTIGTALRTVVDSFDSKWPEVLPIITLAINNSVHTRTGQTPFFTIHDRDPRLPIDNILLLSGVSPANKEFDSYVEHITNDMKSTWKKVRIENEKQNQIIHQQANETNNAGIKQFHIGQLVLKKQKEHHEKLDMKWSGPYRIIGIKKLECFLRQLNNKGKPIRFHVNKIKHLSYH